METLGTALAKRRAELGQTQRQAADRLGVSQPTFGAWERDLSEPGGGYLPPIAAYLRCHEDDLGRMLLATKLKLAGVSRSALSKWRSRQRRHAGGRPPATGGTALR